MHPLLLVIVLSGLQVLRSLNTRGVKVFQFIFNHDAVRPSWSDDAGILRDFQEKISPDFIAKLVEYNANSI
jgi:hypothetical protein